MCILVESRRLAHEPLFLFYKLHSCLIGKLFYRPFLGIIRYKLPMEISGKAFACRYYITFDTGDS